MRDIEKRRAKDRRYYSRNKEKIKVRERQKYLRYHDEIRARRKQLYQSKKELIAERAREDYHQKRLVIIEHYGGKCACCGETERSFLEIDHINNDGWTHRKEIGTSAKQLLLWIIKNDFPETVQILCANCNQGKKRNKGVCPHKGRYS